MASGFSTATMKHQRQERKRCLKNSQGRQFQTQKCTQCQTLNRVWGQVQDTMDTQAFKNSPTPSSEEGTRGLALVNKGVNKKENLGNEALSKKQEAKGIPWQAQKVVSPYDRQQEDTRLQQ